MSQIFNYRSPDVILQEMVAVFQALQPDVSVNEASTIYFLMQTFSYTAAQDMDLADRFSQAAFITTAEGDDLTNLAADRGVTRKDGEGSNVILQLSRAVATDSAVSASASSSFTTDVDESGNYLIFKNFEAITIPASATSATGLAECQSIGEIGNIAANTIINFITSVNGIDTVTNPASAFDGVDEESDEALRLRVTDVLQNNTGRVTVNGYEQTLEALDGCLSATVVPGTGAMPNYITAIVTADNTVDGIPTPTQLSEWSAIVNNDDNRAVVDVIDVIAPSAITITVSAIIDTYSDESDEAETRTRVQQTVIDFINALSPGDVVRRVDVANEIHDDASVVDFTLYAPVGNTDLDTSEKAVATTDSVTIN